MRCHGLSTKLVVIAGLLSGTVALPAGGSAYADRGSSYQAAEAPAQTVTKWKLVATQCDPKEGPFEKVGEACFYPNGHADDWQSVTDNTATSKVNGSQETFLYTLPREIVAGQSNELTLIAEVSQVTDGGAHARSCFTGGFAVMESAETCATTPEEPNGGTGEQEKKLHLIPGEASPGSTQKVTIGFEEPGGWLDFRYRSQPVKVAYSFTATYRTPPDPHLAAIVKLQGQGTFELALLQQDHSFTGGGLNGSASIEFQKTRWHGAPRGSKGAVYTVQLEPLSAAYYGGRSMVVRYRVTRSSYSCVAVGTRLLMNVYANHVFTSVCQLNQYEHVTAQERVTAN